MEPNGSKNPTLKITGADNQPIEIAPGAYYVNTKARAQRLMREPLSPEAGRVHACLELATMGFRQELAVKLDRGRKVPLAPADISSQTGLSKQNTRRALVELENAGLAERRSDDGGPLQKGKVLIFSWALPLPSKTGNGSRRATTKSNPELPPSWAPLVALSKRLRIEIDPQKVLSVIEEGAKIARDYQEAEMAVARFLKGVCAHTKKGAHKSVGRKIVKDKEHTHPAPETPVAASVTAAAPVVRVSPPPSKSSERPKANRPTPAVAPASVPKAPLRRSEEFVNRYPGRTDPGAIRRQYEKSNTSDSEDACHRCLDRYLASDQVHREILMKGERWLRQQASNNWEGEWTRAKGSRLDEWAADYARRRADEDKAHGD